MPLTDFIDESLENEELERAQVIEWRRKIYDGEHPDSLPVVKGGSARPDVNDNVKYNLSKLTVDKGVSFLFGGLDQEVEFTCEDDDQQEALDAVWVANSKKTLLSEAGTNGGICGHVFFRLYETGAPLDQELPRVANLDPAHCLPIYREDDYKIVLGWKIQFPLRGGRVRRVLVEPAVADLADFRPGDAEQWIITAQEARTQSGGRAAWVTVGEPEIWDWPFPPIVDGQNLPAPNLYWGLSDLDGGLIDMNLAINRSLSSMQRILRLHGHPKPYAKGATPDQIQMLVQGVDRIITLPEGTDLGQLEMSGDLGPMVEFFRQMKSAFHEQARNPQVDPEKLGSVGGLSGLALQILYQPLLEQTGTKRGTYGDTTKVLNNRLLQLMEFADPAPTENQWPDPLPVDLKADGEGLLAARQLGLSQRTALERLGFDADTEEERRANDTVTLGAAIGDVLDSAAFNGGGGL